MPRILVLSDPDMPTISDTEAEITQRRVTNYPGDLRSPVVWPMADLAVLAAGQRAGAEGFDAVCVGGADDFGANALRSVLDIPVIGAGRAAMLYALTLGTRFGVLARPGLMHRMKKQVREIGLVWQCAGIEAVDQNTTPEAKARSIPDADVLLLAGSFSRNEADALENASGLPVILPTELSVKIALGFLSLGLTHSARSYPAPQDPKPDLIEGLARAANP